MEILEKTMISRTLVKTKGNRSAAAKALGIHRNTLQRKITTYALEQNRKPVRSEQGRRRRSKAV